MHAVRTGRTLCLAALLLASIPAAPPLGHAQGAPPGMPGAGQAILSDAARFLPVVAPNGMVAAQEAKPTATAASTALPPRSSPHRQPPSPS